MIDAYFRALVLLIDGSSSLNDEYEETMHYYMQGLGFEPEHPNYSPHKVNSNNSVTRLPDRKKKKKLICV